MKKQLFRIFAVLLAVLMLSACMVGCESTEDPGPDDGEKVVLKIAFVKAGFGEDWLKAVLCVRHYRSMKWIQPVTEEGKQGLALWNERRANA